jgi:N-methylhydantoinase B
MMEHGRSGPPGILGGEAGAPNKIQIGRGGRTIVPEHLSKGEGYVLAPGDWIEVQTPGGGGYRPAAERDPALSERDIRRGYFPAGQN